MVFVFFLPKFHPWLSPPFTFFPSHYKCSLPCSGLRFLSPKTQTYIINWTSLLAIIHWSIKSDQIQLELIIANPLFSSLDNNEHPVTWGRTPAPRLSFSPPCLVVHRLTCPPILHLRNHLWSHFSSFPLKHPEFHPLTSIAWVTEGASYLAPLLLHCSPVTHPPPF